MLAKRVVKMEGLRRERREELQKMEQTLTSIREEIREEKEKSKRKILDSKLYLERSRL